jgi:hypothetical protein
MEQAATHAIGGLTPYGFMGTPFASYGSQCPHLRQNTLGTDTAPCDMGRI